jgi:acyl carrier protein
MIFNTLKQALIDQLGIDSNLINLETYIEKDLQLDSTETVILALEIKKKFAVNFKFPDKDISLSEICNFVADQMTLTK